MAVEPVACSCPKCGKVLKVPAEIVGKKIVCKACSTQFVVTPSAKPPEAVAKPAAAPAAPAAAAAPAPPPPPAPAEDAPIPLDDGPIPLAGGPMTEGGDTSAVPSLRPVNLEKLKHTSTGEYMVVKIFLAGKMIQVQIEQTLNECAVDGWQYVQAFQREADLYIIFRRGQPPGAGSK